ncbi:hypothetical protein K443DRAFT_681858 [Laccaria amethystina LaAM-08-1]|uniref:Unplaced genomic scaffold K443scaffold_169, whole genome shotgun sequence n=1 Tax=Laccaria amethystina LaAM-08-1 TaxID=1095629 RepID=A0A0C9X6U9_9AGAR|nr:hypothetical protein K443DRAFT_681858 [Laccaria amethystina LaAM-08-1]
MPFAPAHLISYVTKEKFPGMSSRREDSPKMRHCVLSICARGRPDVGPAWWTFPESPVTTSVWVKRCTP